MTQPLITAEQHAQLLAVGEARATGQSIDPMPVVRLFTRTRTRPGCWPRSILPMAIRPTA